VQNFLHQAEEGRKADLFFVLGRELLVFLQQQPGYSFHRMVPLHEKQQGLVLQFADAVKTVGKRRAVLSKLGGRDALSNFFQIGDERFDGREKKILVFFGLADGGKKYGGKKRKGLVAVLVMAIVAAVFKNKGTETGQDKVPVAKRMTDFQQKSIEAAADPLEILDNFIEQGKARIDDDIFHRCFQQVCLQGIGSDSGGSLLHGL